MKHKVLIALGLSLCASNLMPSGILTITNNTRGKFRGAFIFAGAINGSHPEIEGSFFDIPVHDSISVQFPDSRVGKKRYLVVARDESELESRYFYTSSREPLIPGNIQKFENISDIKRLEPRWHLRIEDIGRTSGLSLSKKYSFSIVDVPGGKPAFDLVAQ